MTITQTVSTARHSSTGLPLDELAAGLLGRLLLPDSDDYAALVAPFNVAAVNAPLAVVAATDPRDVQTAMRFAAAHGNDITVQCTGHGSVRSDRRALMVHTAALDEVTIRPDGSARVGAGVRWSAVIEAAAPLGLAGLVGSAPAVGVVGYTTGGGMGPLSRTFGFASDQVTAFELVTGDGAIRRATPRENTDLFWGLRGGKGALGIVTSVEFNLLPLAEFLGGCLYFDGSDAPAVLHAWSRWCQDLPEQATTSVAVLRLPPLSTVPAPLAGRCTVAVRFAWVGDPATGREVLAGIAEVAPVIFGGVDVMPYAAVGFVHADPVDPMPTHEEVTLLGALPADAVDTLLAIAGPEAPCPQVIVEMRLLGGALRRAALPSAICHREAAFTLLTIGIAAPGVIEATTAHARALMSAVEPWSLDAGLPNFAPSTDPARISRNYDQATLQRLGALARSYDPHGVLAAAHALRAATADGR